MRAQKQSDLEQLLQLLQLSSVAAEPQLKQQQMADSRRGQDLQTALGLMGLQQAGEHDKASHELALQQLTQSGQQFGEGQKLSREQLAQQGLLGERGLGIQEAGNKLMGDKMAQDERQFNTHETGENTRATGVRDLQMQLAALQGQHQVLSNPNLTGDEDMMKHLLSHPNDLAMGYTEGKAAGLERKLNADVYPNLDKLRGKSGTSPEDDTVFTNYFHSLPIEHKIAALKHLGVNTRNILPNELDTVGDLQSNWHLHDPKMRESKGFSIYPGPTPGASDTFKY